MSIAEGQLEAGKQVTAISAERQLLTVERARRANGNVEQSSTVITSGLLEHASTNATNPGTQRV